MEKHFQIGEIDLDLDPFDGDERTTLGESWPGEGTGTAEQCSEAARGRRVGDAESLVFQDGVPQARRATLPEVELLEVIPSFRGRTQSEPANFWIAVQYGRELRRMSDEFVSTFTENKGLRISKSAGAIMSRFYRRMTNFLPGTGAPGGRQADDR